MENVLDVLVKRKRVVFIKGEAGNGKSEFLKEYAEKRKTAYLELPENLPMNFFLSLLKAFYDLEPYSDFNILKDLVEEIKEKENLKILHQTISGKIDREKKFELFRDFEKIFEKYIVKPQRVLIVDNAENLDEFSRSFINYYFSVNPDYDIFDHFTVIFVFNGKEVQENFLEDEEKEVMEISINKERIRKYLFQKYGVEDDFTEKLFVLPLENALHAEFLTRYYKESGKLVNKDLKTLIKEMFDSLEPELKEGLFPFIILPGDMASRFMFKMGKESILALLLEKGWLVKDDMGKFRLYHSIVRNVIREDKWGEVSFREPLVEFIKAWVSPLIEGIKGDAFHFLGLYKQAFSSYRNFAHLLANIGNNLIVIDVLTRALELAEQLKMGEKEDFLTIYYTRGWAYYNVYHFQKAEDDIARAYNLAVKLDKKEFKDKAEILLNKIKIRRGDIVKVKEYVDSLLKTEEKELSSESMMALVSLYKELLYDYNVKFKKTPEVLLPYLHRIEEPEDVLTILYDIALICISQGKFDRVSSIIRDIKAVYEISFSGEYPVEVDLINIFKNIKEKKIEKEAEELLTVVEQNFYEAARIERKMFIGKELSRIYRYFPYNKKRETVLMDFIKFVRALDIKLELICSIFHTAQFFYSQGDVYKAIPLYESAYSYMEESTDAKLVLSIMVHLYTSLVLGTKMKYAESIREEIVNFNVKNIPENDRETLHLGEFLYSLFSLKKVEHKKLLKHKDQSTYFASLVNFILSCDFKKYKDMINKKLFREFPMAMDVIDKWWKTELGIYESPFDLRKEAVHNLFLRSFMDYLEAIFTGIEGGDEEVKKLEEDLISRAPSYPLVDGLRYLSLIRLFGNRDPDKVMHYIDEGYGYINNRGITLLEVLFKLFRAEVLIQKGREQEAERALDFAVPLLKEFSINLYYWKALYLYSRIKERITSSSYSGFGSGAQIESSQIGVSGVGIDIDYVEKFSNEFSNLIKRIQKELSEEEKKKFEIYYKSYIQKF